MNSPYQPREPRERPKKTQLGIVQSEIRQYMNIQISDLKYNITNLG